MSHTEGNFKFCINLAVHQGNSSPSTNKRGQGGHFDLHKSTEQVKWVLYLNKIKKKKKNSMLKQPLLTQVQKTNRIIMGLIPSHLPAHAHRPERKLSTLLQEPWAELYSTCGSADYKQWEVQADPVSLEQGTCKGAARGQILTKERLAGSSSAAQRAQWCWILKKGPCQGCSKSKASPKEEEARKWE